MAAVFALACATLLYTGCTKDYSEDLSKLESRVDAIEGTAIKTLKEQVAALESAKTELENAKKAANDAIAELQGKVSSLEQAKTSLESAVKNLQTEIAKKADKTEVEALEDKLTGLQNEVNALKDAKTLIEGRISTLETKVGNLDDAIKKINEDLAKKADKSYVDDELAKKADKSYVDEELAKKASTEWVNETLKTYATIKYVDEKIAGVQGQINTINTAVNTLKGRMATAEEYIYMWMDIIPKLQKGLTGAQDDIKALQGSMKTAQDDIKALQDDMTSVKGTLTTYKGLIDGLRLDLQGALTDIQEIKDALEDIYTKAEVDELVKAVKDEVAKKADKSYVDGELAKKVDNTTFVEELAKKLNIEAYAADTAKLNAQVRKIESDLAAAILAYQAADRQIRLDFAAADQDVIDAFEAADLDLKAAYEQADKDLKKGYEDADEVLQGQIDNLKTDVNDLKTTKLDKTTFDDFVKDYNDAIKGIEADIKKLLNRVQSLVYVPKYASHNIPLNYAVLYSENEEANDLDPVEVAGEIVNPQQTIAAESHVKYRVYGVDASTIVTNLVAAVNKEIKDGADSSAILSFDVVRVASKLNLDDVAVWVVGAEVDDMNPDIIDLTVKTVGLADDFFNNVANEAPAYSMSLVLTDNEASRLITSEYWTIVPGERTAIEVDIFDNDGAGKKSIAGILGETIELPYNYAEDTLLLKDHVVLFNIEGEEYTYEELLEAGYSVPAITGKIVEYPDFTNAIDEGKIEADPYFVVDPKKGEASIESYASLAENCFGAVGAVDSVLFVYNFGWFELPTSSKIIVTPYKVAVEADLWESETLEPFTWNYKKDAASDIDRGEAREGVNERDTVFGSYDAAKVAAAFEKAGIKFSDFDHKVPASFKVYVADADADPEQLTATLDIPGTLPSGFEEVDGVNIIPFFDEGVLSANVTGFEFGKKYYYEAVYELPGAAAEKECAVEVTVTGQFTTADRNREPIVIVLPESTFDFDVAAIDTTFNVKDDATSIEISLEDAHLTDADLADALIEHLSQTDSVKTLELIYSEDETVEFDITDNGPRCNHKTVQIFAEGCEDDAMDITTLLNLHSLLFTGIDTLATQYDYTDTLTLWYGQKVIVEKTININTEDIFEFERINEYVVWDPAGLLHTTYTVLQPWWTPDDATLDLNLYVETYDAHEVLLDQHFRVRNQKTGESCTELDGSMKSAYNYLRRTFYLEDGEVETTEIADPRNIDGIKVPAATGVKVNNNVVEYYSMAEFTDVYGHLDAVIPENGCVMPLVTRFDKANANWPVVKNDAAEDYVTYAIKLYDPLQEIVAPEDIQEVNINNSVVRPTSIYDFLSLKDKRNKELIDGQSENGWVLGDDKNGFKAGIGADVVYSLSFTNTMEYISTVSDETKNRISFDNQTGKITFDNTLQTQLAEPILVKLGIVVDYPWGQRVAYVTVKYYNKPVGE